MVLLIRKAKVELSVLVAVELFLNKLFALENIQGKYFLY